MQRCNNQTARVQLASQQRMGTQPKKEKNSKNHLISFQYKCAGIWDTAQGAHIILFCKDKAKLIFPALGIECVCVVWVLSCLFLKKASVNYVIFLFFNPKEKKSHQQKFVSHTSNKSSIFRSPKMENLHLTDKHLS